MRAKINVHNILIALYKAAPPNYSEAQLLHIAQQIEYRLTRWAKRDRTSFSFTQHRNSFETIQIRFVRTNDYFRSNIKVLK